MKRHIIILYIPFFNLFPTDSGVIPNKLLEAHIAWGVCSSHITEQENNLNYYKAISHIIRCEHQRLIACKNNLVTIIDHHIIIIFMNCERLHQTWWRKKTRLNIFSLVLLHEYIQDTYLMMGHHWQELYVPCKALRGPAEIREINLHNFHWWEKVVLIMST